MGKCNILRQHYIATHTIWRHVPYFFKSTVIPLLSLAASSTSHSTYGETSPASTFSRSTKFQRIKSLPFVPVDDISCACEVLKPAIPSDNSDFTQHCESTWIGTPNSPVKFDPACWNQHDSALAGLPRSSNIDVGWHLGFKSLVQWTNPILWTIFDALKLEQGLTDQKIAVQLMFRQISCRQIVRVAI